MLKLLLFRRFFGGVVPAAFRRLCVETSTSTKPMPFLAQPPLGGCVLKPVLLGCRYRRLPQPPLGGCVLKLMQMGIQYCAVSPAAFRRLCVETKMPSKWYPT